MEVQATTTVSLLQLSAHLQIEGNALKLAFSSGVFKSSQRCGGCNAEMTLQSYSSAPEKVCWRCPRCRKRLSVRTQSILQDSKLSLDELFILSNSP